MSELQAEAIIALLERIAVALEANGDDAEATPPPKGMCVLCDTPVKWMQLSGEAPGGQPGIRHVVAADCPGLQ